MALKAALAEEKPKAFVSKIKKMLSQGKKDHDNVTSFLSGGGEVGVVRLHGTHLVQPSRVRTLDLGKIDRNLLYQGLLPLVIIHLH